MLSVLSVQLFSDKFNFINYEIPQHLDKIVATFKAQSLTEQKNQPYVRDRLLTMNKVQAYNE